MRSILLALPFAFAASAAFADTTEGYLCEFPEVFEPTTCSVTTTPDETGDGWVVVWRGGGQEVRWVGQMGYGFIFGQLNGKDGACYYFNRSHIGCGTSDRMTGFEAWWPGQKQGGE